MCVSVYHSACVCKAEDNQKKADRLYELKMRELDQRACELQRAEEDCRRAINEATKNYNVAQVRSPQPLLLLTIRIYSHQDVHIKSTSSSVSCDDNSEQQLNLPSLMSEAAQTL